jgi:hypothetical protein
MPVAAWGKCVTVRPLEVRLLRLQRTNSSAPGQRWITVSMSQPTKREVYDNDVGAEKKPSRLPAAHIRFAARLASNDSTRIHCWKADCDVNVKLKCEIKLGFSS